MKIDQLAPTLLQNLRRGVVIPAHPLAINQNRQLDEQYQRALTRYYIDAGAGGIAVGVHTTQFHVRDPKYDLYRPILELASETVDNWSQDTDRQILKVAGICGKTQQALSEVATAVESGYHAGLLNLSAMKHHTIPAVIDHCRAVAEILPVFGFFLQPAIGGCLLPFEFWRQFAEIENVLAIKIAAFNRYQTIDVVRAVCEAGREHEIALYTGNDDNIINDLLTTYRFQNRTVRIVGGLLGHWACWTTRAVQQLQRAHEISDAAKPIPQEMLALNIEVTDANAAFFDAAHDFAGCIPGIHEVLQRQGLLQGNWCLAPEEMLSGGQLEEIDRVCRAYPHLNDDDFVARNLDTWLE